jgi:hypothetical protein
MNGWQHTMIWMGVLCLYNLETSYHTGNDIMELINSMFAIVCLIVGSVAHYKGWPKEGKP